MSEPLPSSLAAAPAGQALTVHQVSAPGHSPEWASWLADLGFLPGEAVRVLRRGAQLTGNLVVRVGQSTFALRHAEAECIAVTPRRHD
ncbi:ferrous iron transport protein A [Pelomonas saccharophila]|uniref:Ferrous iron transport protein A n=1 Tax=Roseateles saccharophilus TaxID=304 RepID=A0ABU1YHR9_ROSSA|nr:FeoA family protein [Roseateles saccharophilus]MDR7267581.1 ferrous iron transport protein A [Roseateles saccharophilus]